MATEGIGNLVTEYFPIIKWIIGGLAAAVAVLLGIIYKNHKSRLDDLEGDVGQLSREASRHITYDDLDKLKEDMHRKFNHMEEKLSTSLDQHNKAVNDKLDKIMWHMIDNEK